MAEESKKHSCLMVDLLHAHSSLYEAHVKMKEYVASRGVACVAFFVVDG